MPSENAFLAGHTDTGKPLTAMAAPCIIFIGEMGCCLPVKETVTGYELTA